jgi:succinate dehydrogenase / fumarate reductase cytochrome b subunit
MSKQARVTLSQFVAYRGGQPMLAWLLHRIAGIGIVLFVGLHVFAGFFLYAIEGGATSTAANALTDFYASRPMQVFLLFALLYHGLNGLRIVVLDMWPGLHRFHREAMWVQWAVFLPVFSLLAFLIALGIKIE